ncbi:MAG: hypothetical protein L6Q95_09830, partial [Planctomycetes bacterium]|nr:hypothetical protein [Planctomycetota bacterium]
MRLLGLLLLAAAVGFAVGRLTAPEAGGRGGERRSRQAAPPTFPVPLPAPAPASPAPEPSEAPADPPEGTGWLEVSTVGAPRWEEITLEAPSLRGEWQTIEFDLDEPVTRMEVAACRYRILARAAGDLSPRTWHFAIEPGATVRIDLGAAPTPDRFPIPAGLGRLDFEVHDMDGAPLAGAMLAVRRLGPPSGEDGEIANEEGKGRLHLIPGRYFVAMGAQHRTVQVEAGTAVEVVFRYADEGEVVLDESIGRDAFLEFVRGGEGPHVSRVHATTLFGSPTPRLVYVRPGLHQVRLDDGCRDRSPLGEIDVRPGSVTTFGAGLPAGGLEIHVKGFGDASRFPLEITAPDGATFRASLSYRFITSANGDGSTDVLSEIRYLPRGRYRVRFDYHGWQPAVADVDVGEDVASVTL